MVYLVKMTEKEKEKKKVCKYLRIFKRFGLPNSTICVFKNHTGPYKCYLSDPQTPCDDRVFVDLVERYRETDLLQPGKGGVN